MNFPFFVSSVKSHSFPFQIKYYELRYQEGERRTSPNPFGLINLSGNIFRLPYIVICNLYFVIISIDISCNLEFETISFIFGLGSPIAFDFKKYLLPPAVHIFGNFTLAIFCPPAGPV